MKKLVAVVLAILFIVSFPFIVAGKTESSHYWIKVVSSKDIKEVYPQSMKLTNDDGFIVSGYYRTDQLRLIAYASKTDSAGNVSWIRSFDIALGSKSESVVQTDDGGYLVVGESLVTQTSKDSNSDIVVIRLSPKGTIKWVKKIGSKYNDLSSFLQETSDGGFIISGVCAYELSNYSMYNAFLLKLDEDGNRQWMKVVGTVMQECFNSVQETTDGGYIAVGRTGYEDNQNILIVKFDDQGNILWSKSYHIATNDIGIRIIETKDGYVVTASSKDNNNLLLKVDKSGNLIWAKAIGIFDEKNKNDLPWSLTLSSDGSIIVGGSTFYYDTSYFDGYVTKLDSDGNAKWTRIFDSGRTSDDVIISTAETKNGDIVSVGRTSLGSDLPDHFCYFVKLNSMGDALDKCSAGKMRTTKIDMESKSLNDVVVANVNLASMNVSDFMSSFEGQAKVADISFTEEELCNENTVISPTAPQITKAQADDASITLYWTLGTTGSYPINGYTIYRGTSSNGELEKPIVIVDANTTFYTDKNITGGTTYYYYVKAFDNQVPPNYSEASNEISVKIDTFIIASSVGVGGSILPSGSVTVNYGDLKSFTITPDKGYKISDVKVDGKSVGAVSTYTFQNVTADHTIEATFEKSEIVIVLQVGQTSFTVNGVSNTLDSPPVIKNGRTLLPIRAVIEALNGSVGWDAATKKVTVSLGSNTIELWIGRSNAKVNGIDTPIDSTNSKVVPEIINGRTMLPLRFVTENLGCGVQWDGTTQTITIRYKG
jgi:hypothetical protein